MAATAVDDSLAKKKYLGENTATDKHTTQAGTEMGQAQVKLG